MMSLDNFIRRQLNWLANQPVTEKPRLPRRLERFSIVLNRDVLVEDSQIGWNERFCAG